MANMDELVHDLDEAIRLARGHALAAEGGSRCTEREMAMSQMWSNVAMVLAKRAELKLAGAMAVAEASIMQDAENRRRGR